jgi:hypothetical protein
MQFFRRPRSKKRRILKKWRGRPENWRPHPMVFEQRVAMGPQAMLRAVPGESYPVLMMHPEVWERLKRRRPEVVELAIIREWEATAKTGPSINWRDAVS